MLACDSSAFARVSHLIALPDYRWLSVSKNLNLSLNFGWIISPAICLIPTKQLPLKSATYRRRIETVFLSQKFFLLLSFFSFSCVLEILGWQRSVNHELNECDRYANDGLMPHMTRAEKGKSSWERLITLRNSGKITWRDVDDDGGCRTWAKITFSFDEIVAWWMKLHHPCENSWLKHYSFNVTFMLNYLLSLARLIHSRHKVDVREERSMQVQS